jgi:hypothetical protein
MPFRESECQKARKTEREKEMQIFKYLRKAIVLILKSSSRLDWYIRNLFLITFNNVESF